MNIKHILEAHVGTEIGVNISTPMAIDSVELVAVHDDYFTLMNHKDGNISHIPFFNIVKIMENPEGVTVGGFFKQHKTHPLVVKTGHVVQIQMH